MLDRRSFLRRLGFGTIGAAAAALSFDVEKLLWVPGEKAIFIPPAAVVRGSTFLTADWVARECLTLFERSLTFAQYVDRRYSMAGA